MDRRTEKQLIRLLLGELPEEDSRRLRERLLKEEDLQQAFSSLQERWAALEPPPPRPVPQSFASQVVNRAVSGSPKAATGWGSASPLWARAAAPVALASGVLLGALLASPTDTEEWAAWTTDDLTQAEVYWETLGGSSTDLLLEDLP